MSWDETDRSYQRQGLKRSLKKLFVWALKLGLFILIIGLCIAGWYFFLSAKYDLTEVAEMPARSVLLDRNGTEIDTLHGSNRRLLEKDEIPTFFITALFAREDATFMEHPGVDLKGLIRATVRNIIDRDFTQGASTLTMQLARNSFELREQSLNRKLLEIALSFRIESRYSKDEILTHYLNRIYFGSGAHGLEEASLTYFGRQPGDLNGHEMILLAGIIRGPHAFSPFRHLDLAKKQAQEVAARLVATAQISQHEADLILQSPLRLVPDDKRYHSSAQAASAIDRHLAVILDNEQIVNGGLEIQSTIDGDLQKRIEDLIAKLPLPPDCETAALALQPVSGDILAIVGNRIGHPSVFNRALDARRGVGDIIEPFIDACAREMRKLPIEGNPAATGRQVGEEKTIALLGRLGFTGPFGSGDDLFRGTLSATPLEVATAAATLANLGQRPHTRFVSQIKIGDEVFFKGPSELYPAFSAHATDQKIFGKAFVGSSPGSLDYWYLRIEKNQVLLFWFGFDQPKAFRVTPDLKRRLDRF